MWEICWNSYQTFRYCQIEFFRHCKFQRIWNRVPGIRRSSRSTDGIYSVVWKYRTLKQKTLRVLCQKCERSFRGPFREETGSFENHSEPRKIFLDVFRHRCTCFSFLCEYFCELVINWFWIYNTCNTIHSDFTFFPLGNRKWKKNHRKLRLCSIPRLLWKLKLWRTSGNSCKRSFFLTEKLCMCLQSFGFRTGKESAKMKQSMKAFLAFLLTEKPSRYATHWRTKKGLTDYVFFSRLADFDAFKLPVSAEVVKEYDDYIKKWVNFNASFWTHFYLLCTVIVRWVLLRLPKNWIRTTWRPWNSVISSCRWRRTLWPSTCSIRMFAKSRSSWWIWRKRFIRYYNQRKMRDDEPNQRKFTVQDDSRESVESGRVPKTNEM